MSIQPIFGRFLTHHLGFLINLMYILRLLWLEIMQNISSIDLIVLYTGGIKISKFPPSCPFSKPIFTLHCYIQKIIPLNLKSVET